MQHFSENVSQKQSGSSRLLSSFHVVEERQVASLQAFRTNAASCRSLSDSGQCINDPKLLILLFLIFIQCHLCTTKSNIKKEPQPRTEDPGEKTRPYKASVEESGSHVCAPSVALRPRETSAVLGGVMFADMLMRKSKGRNSVLCLSCWRNHALRKLQTGRRTRRSVPFTSRRRM